MFLVTISVTIFALAYAWGSSTEGFWLLMATPSNTMFMISILGNIAVALLNAMVRTTFDNLRWKLSCQPSGRGIGFLEFIALSGSTSVYGFLKLMVFNKSSNNGNESRRWWRIRPFRLAAIIRFVYFEFMLTLTDFFSSRLSLALVSCLQSIWISSGHV